MSLIQYNPIELNPSAMTKDTTPPSESCVVDLNSELELQKDDVSAVGKSHYTIRDNVITNFNFEELNLTGDDLVTASDLFKVSWKIVCLGSCSLLLMNDIINYYLL